MNNTTSKIRSAVDRILYSSEVFLFFSAGEAQCTSPARIVRATKKDINDVLDFQSKKYIETFGRFLDHNDICYLAYLHSKCVHRSFVIDGPCEVCIDKFLKREIKKEEIFIHYCETALSARGHGVYPAVLTQICRDFREKRILLAVDSKNSASIRGVTKAGFIPFERIKILIIFGIRIVKKYKMETQIHNGHCK